MSLPSHFPNSLSALKQVAIVNCSGGNGSISLTEIFDHILHKVLVLSSKIHLIFVQGQPQDLAISFKGPVQEKMLPKTSSGNTICQS